MSEENMVKNVIWEIVLDIRSNNIEKVFHLPIFDQYKNIVYEIANI